MKPSTAATRHALLIADEIEAGRAYDFTPEGRRHAAESIRSAVGSMQEQAQTAVGLPEPHYAVSAQNVLSIMRLFKSGSLTPNCDEGWDAVLSAYAAQAFTADQMEAYATAKTAEAVRELVFVLRYIKAQTHVGHIQDTASAALAKYAPKKEQGNG